MKETVPPKSGKYLTIDLEDYDALRINWIAECCNIKKRADTYNTAIAILSWAVLEGNKGKIIVSSRDDKIHSEWLLSEAIKLEKPGEWTRDLGRPPSVQ